jgi:hypothetical protein
LGWNISICLTPDLTCALFRYDHLAGYPSLGEDDDGVHDYDTDEETADLPVLCMMLPVSRLLATADSGIHFDTAQNVDALIDQAEGGTESRIVWQRVENAPPPHRV